MYFFWRLIHSYYSYSETVSDRYYVALYKKMSDPHLKASSKQSMFLNLLFKSIKKDTVDRRVKVKYDFSDWLRKTFCKV